MEKTEWQRGIEAQLAENTKITAETSEKVQAVHDTLQALSGAFTVFKWTATALKYLTYVLGAIGAAIGLYKLGVDVNAPPRIDIPK
jgi:hypothetical protein